MWELKEKLQKVAPKIQPLTPIAPYTYSVSNAISPAVVPTDPL